MENPFKNIIDSFKTFYLVGIKLSNKGNSFFILEILYKNEEISIINKFQSNTPEDEITTYLKKDYPIVLHLYGDKVISKETTNQVGYRNNLIFNTNPADYYFYEYHQDKQIFLSLARKSLVDDIEKSLNEKDKFIVHISMGPFVLVNLLPLIDAKELFSSEYYIEIEDSNIVSYSKEMESDEILFFGDEGLRPQESPLIASFLEYKFTNEKMLHDFDFVIANREEQGFKRKFKLFGVTSLVIVLLFLIIGHLVLAHYMNALAEKETLNTISQQTIMNIENLREELQVKEKILTTNRVVNNNYLTQYIMDIGNSVEPEIMLSSVELLPLVKKIKPTEKINFLASEISVSGQTSDDRSFNDWIKKMNEFTWLEKLEILDYNQLSSNKSEFIIRINI